MKTKEQITLNAIEDIQREIEYNFEQQIKGQLRIILQAEQEVKKAQDNLEKQKKVLSELQIPEIPQFNNILEGG